MLSAFQKFTAKIKNYEIYTKLHKKKILVFKNKFENENLKKICKMAKFTGELSVVSIGLVGRYNGEYIDYIDNTNEYEEIHYIIITGFGEIKYKNGNSYIGEWKNNLYHGRGTLKFPNGDILIIEGSFTNGKLDQKNCDIHYQSGNYYNGEIIIKKGMIISYIRHGYGNMKFSDGTRYEGFWNNDMFHGEGKLDLNNDDYYEGNFENGLFHLHGKYISIKNMTIYEGEFYHGKRHGKGKFIYDNKNIEINGIWNNDSLVSHHNNRICST
jgi:hypothetical protein